MPTYKGAKYLKIFTKDPGEKLDYPIDWSPWLAGRTVTAAVSTPTGTGLTVNSTTFTSTGTVTRLSVGNVGDDYPVAVHVTNNDGTEGERSFLIKVRQR